MSSIDIWFDLIHFPPIRQPCVYISTEFQGWIYKVSFHLNFKRDSRQSCRLPSVCYDHILSSFPKLLIPMEHHQLHCSVKCDLLLGKQVLRVTCQGQKVKWREIKMSPLCIKASFQHQNIIHEYLHKSVYSYLPTLPYTFMCRF